MATAAAAPAAEGAAAPKGKGKGKGKLIAIIVGVLVLACAGGAGAMIFLKPKGKATADEKAHVEKKQSVFAPLDPFTVNLNDPGREHYLQIGLTFEVSGTDIADALKSQMPLVRSRVLLLLTSKGAEELASPEGKAKLAGELVTLVRTPMGELPIAGVKTENRGVIDVHFSSFIIQ